MLAAASRAVGGGTVDFTLPASGAISTTTANANISGGQQTILGGFATVGGTTWAVSGSGATAGAISGLPTLSYATAFTSGTDVDTPTGSSTPTAGTYNSWRFNNSGAYAVSPAGNITIATGGILETSGVGSNAVTIDTASTTNTLTSGGLDLVAINNNTAGNALDDQFENNGRYRPDSLGGRRSHAHQCRQQLHRHSHGQRRGQCRVVERLGYRRRLGHANK